MATFYVLTPPNAADPDRDTILIRDGFSWMGFLFALPWLLARGLWLIALTCIAAFVALAQLGDAFDVEGLPAAFAIVLSLWVGFEGGHLRAQRLQSRHWALRDIVAAPDRATAEEIYFASQAELRIEKPKSFVLGPDNTARTAPTVALGLIEPYGGR